MKWFPLCIHPQVQTELRRRLRKCRNQNHPTPAKRSITQITSRAREGFAQPSSANISSVWHLEAMTERCLTVREGSWSGPRTPTGRQQQLRWTQSEKNGFSGGAMTEGRAHDWREPPGTHRHTTVSASTTLAWMLKDKMEPSAEKNGWFIWNELRLDRRPQAPSWCSD